MTQATPKPLQKLKPKPCTARVRRAAEIEPCGVILRTIKDYGQICPNKAQHLNPFVTGFCHSGWHEGQKVNKPTCKFWETCPCDCHTTISRMMVLTETDRTLQDNSTWRPPEQFIMVNPVDVAVQKTVVESNARIIESEAPSLVPHRIERTFASTESGRAARGQLESLVREITDKWATNPDLDQNCTPPYVAEQLEKMYGERRSTGAIDAVFKRWQAIGFANIGLKPTRFISYTPAGIREGLESLKEKARRA